MSSPTNIRIHGLSYANRLAELGWEKDGARFHVWIKTDTLTDTGILYKNPPNDIEFRGPEYFDTRHLDPTAKANAATVEFAKQYARDHDLVNKARADLQAEKNREAADLAEAARIATIKEAGPDLLAALQDCVADLENWKTDHEEPGEPFIATEKALEKARAAIKAATT